MTKIKTQLKFKTKNSFRTSPELDASYIGGTGGRATGALTGMFIGSAIFPGVGTLIGGCIGGFVGLITGVEDKSTVDNIKTAGKGILGVGGQMKNK